VDLMQSNVKKISFEPISNVHYLRIARQTKNIEAEVKTNIFGK